ncbi:hypothetical protein [Capnocytophaga gingivalis]|nr:hypothetical protein [Capnocytophaga gingivalis]
MPPTKERVALQKDELPYKRTNCPDQKGELQFAPTGVEITPIHSIFANYR